MKKRAIIAIQRTISFIKEAPGIPTLYVKKTDTKDENGRKIRRNWTEISKIETLVVPRIHWINRLREAIKSIKKSCE